jgi:hypothetical protein
VPPEEGMAVANSDLERAAGKMQTAASKYANQTEEPVFAAASPGSTKMPLPSIPPMLMAMTDVKERLLSSFFKLGLNKR